MAFISTMIEKRGKDVRSLSLGINYGFNCFYRKHDSGDEKEGSQIHCTHRRWLLVLLILITLEFYYNVVTCWKLLHSNNRRLNYVNTSTNKPNVTRKEAVIYYKYPLNNLVDVSMDYKNSYNSSYYWFISMQHLFKNIGVEEIPSYPNDTPICQLNDSSFGPILVNKSEPTLEWVEQQNLNVKLGGNYAPAHCHATHRVAVIVPYRDRKANLAVFLRNLHPFLKKQQLEYRIFVIEQYGTEPFNKGTLYNIAFLETQRFGTWHCLIFHDVDLIPEDERISYSCPEHPTHMSVSVEAQGYTLPYISLFGGVTSLTPEQFMLVNGYSNFYWSWGAEDDDMYVRHFFLVYSKLRYLKEGLTSTKYNLINVTQKKLFTHILADVNPIKMKLDLKSMLRQIVYLFDNSLTYAGLEVVSHTGMLHVDEK